MRLILSVLVWVIALGMAPAPARDTPRDPEVVRERLEELRDRMARVQAELAGEARRRDELVGELADAERRLDRIAANLRQVESRLTAVRERLDGLNAEKRALNENLARQREHLAASVRSAYAMGRQERLKLLLNQEDVAAAGRVMAYYQYFNRDRIRRIESVTRELRRLGEVEAAIEQRESELAGLRERRASELAEEQSAMEERQRVLVRIRARMEEQGETLAALKRDEQTLESVLREIEQALADIPQELSRPFAGLKGRLAWPLGDSRGASADEAGLLIPAQPGSRVMAVAPGRVAYADWLRGYGLLVILDHGDGFMSLYAHNQTLYKEVGDWVSDGEPLGEVGASGGRSEPALYFELRRNGEPIPALAWLGPARG